MGFDTVGVWTGELMPDGGAEPGGREDIAIVLFGTGRASAADWSQSTVEVKNVKQVG